MTTIYEHLVQMSGSSGEKDKGVGICPDLKTSTFGNLPVYEKPFGLLLPEFNKRGVEEAFIKMRAYGGFVYPLYAGFGSNIVSKVGERLVLPNNLETSYLPFFSIGGRVKNIRDSGDGHIYLDLNLSGEKNFTIAVSPERNKIKETDGLVYQVATANYTQEDYDREKYVKDLYFGREYSFYKVEEKNFSKSFTDLIDTRASGGRRSISRNLNEKDVQKLDGSIVLAGPSPTADYFFCDFSLETDSYTWPSAWYTKDGIPIMDAILFTKK